MFITFFKTTFVQIKGNSTNSSKTRPGNQILWRTFVLSSSQHYWLRFSFEYKQNSGSSQEKITLMVKKISDYVNNLHVPFLASFYFQRNNKNIQTPCIFDFSKLINSIYFYFFCYRFSYLFKLFVLLCIYFTLFSWQLLQIVLF